MIKIRASYWWFGTWIINECQKNFHIFGTIQNAHFTRKLLTLHLKNTKTHFFQSSLFKKQTFWLKRSHLYRIQAFTTFGAIFTCICLIDRSLQHNFWESKIPRVSSITWPKPSNLHLIIKICEKTSSMWIYLSRATKACLLVNLALYLNMKKIENRLLLRNGGKKLKKNPGNCLN